MLLESAMDGFIGALVGALIGGLVTSFVTIFTLRFSYRDLFAKTVSTSRNEWINVWREELSRFLAISDILRYETKNICYKDDGEGKGGSTYLEMLEEYHISKNKIIMRLNMNEKRHQEVYLLINKIAYENNLGNEDYKVAKEALMAVSRDLLKDEWERVKLEARGKKRK